MDPETMSGDGLDLAAAAEKLLTLETPPDDPDKDDELEGEAAEPADEGAPEADFEDVDESEADADAAPEDESEADDESSPAEEEPDDDTSPTYTVKVDGEPVEVTLDEALAGYIRQKTFTQRTMALAEERKALQQEYESAQTERSKYGSGLQDLEKVLGALLPAEPDWDKVRQEHPDQYAAIHAEYTQRKQILDSVKTERERVQEERQAALEKARTEMLQNEKTALATAIPEWRDPETYKADQVALAKYATEEYGFTPEELEGVTDHRAVVLLRKAMLYDRATSKGQPARKDKKPVKKALKPGASGPARKKPKAKHTARNRLKRTGSLHDAAAALLESTKG